MNSKQLLIAVVAASIGGVATASIAISGAAKFNAKDGVYSHEADLFIAGKSGDSTFSMNVAMNSWADTTPIIEDAYVSTAVAGVNVKMGQWRSGKSELTQTSIAFEGVEVSTSFGGLSLAYRDRGYANSITIGGSLAGVKVSHKINQDTSTETKASGSMGGVSIAAHSKESAASLTNTAVTLSTEVQGVTLTYVVINNDSTVAVDGYIGKFILDVGKKADAIGIKTAISGNTVQFKAITKGGVDTNKVIVTRGLAAGTTFEATYVDTDGEAAILDLELAVKF